jgi:type I restriction enzyme S subunit
MGAKMSEVRRGYKQTEVGVIPEDWGIVELIETARVVDSLHQTPSFSDDGYPMVRVTDIRPGNLTFNGTLMVTGAVFVEFTKNYKPKRGDIVLSRVGSYGVSSFVETDEPFCMGQNTVILQPKLPPRFLYYVLNSRSIRQQIEDGSYGSGYKSLSLKNIKELRIPFPPTCSEQTAIAQALSDADALIESLEQLLTKKRQTKQGAMQELLTGKKRLPGFQSKPGYKKTAAGLIPEDWAHPAFGRLYAEPSRNGIYKTAAYQGRGTRIVNMGEMFGYEFISDQDMSRVMLTPRELIISGLQNGDLLFGRRSVVPAGAGKCSLVLPPSEPLTFESSIIRVRLNEAEACPLFYYYFFASPKGRSTVGTIVSGTNIKGIRASELRELKVPLPARIEQESIAEALSDMDTDIAALETKLTKARQLKQGMMQNLLTGKIRLV